MVVERLAVIVARDGVSDLSCGEGMLMFSRKIQKSSAVMVVVTVYIHQRQFLRAARVVQIPRHRLRRNLRLAVLIPTTNGHTPSRAPRLNKP